MSPVKYLFDEDLNGRIVRGVRRRISDLDSRTVQEADLPEASDPAVLDWAATQGRVVITHDHRTMRPCAEDRLKAGMPMTGLILVRQTAALGQVIDDLVLVAEATTAVYLYLARVSVPILARALPRRLRSAACAPLSMSFSS